MGYNTYLEFGKNLFGKIEVTEGITSNIVVLLKIGIQILIKHPVQV